MIVLGLHFEHDAGATLMKDGRILANVEAERVAGLKHASGLGVTRAALTAALAQADVRAQDVDALAFSDLCEGAVFTPELGRRPEIQRHTHAGALAARLGTLADVGFDGILGRNAFPFRADIPVFVTCHSMSHAAGAVYMAGFPEALGLVIDGYGTCCGMMGYAYHDHVLTRREEFQDRFLLGTGYHGVGILAREIVRTDALDVAGKVMGLQAYGQPATRLGGLLPPSLFHEQRGDRIRQLRPPGVALQRRPGDRAALRRTVPGRAAPQQHDRRRSHLLRPGGLDAGGLHPDRLRPGRLTRRRHDPHPPVPVGRAAAR